MKGDGERLAVVETKIENVDKAVARIEQKLDSFTSSFTPLKNTQGIDKRVTSLENKKLIRDTATWILLVGSVLLNVLAFYERFGK